MPELLLAIDAGTTTARACLFSAGGELVARASAPVRSVSPAPGRVEQDARAIWRRVLRLTRMALAAAGREPADLAAIGVTTQRTSLVAWDKSNGRTLGPMIVWSDLRGTERAEALRAAGYAIAPQQAAAKLEALLAGIPDAQALAAAGRLAVGNIDAFLVWKLTGGVHATDRSQAWPTGYLDLGSLGWNRALLGLQGLDESILPKLVDTWGPIGTTARAVIGAEIPVAAIVADQQSALIGHGAETAGAVKVTYGTSATLDAGTGGGFVFAGMSTPPFVVSHVAGETRFCLEGMVFSAGAAVDWLRRTMRLGDHTAFEALAASAADAGGVAFLPALHGLGAPHGDPSRRAVLNGLSGATGPAEIARAALEGVAFRVREILDHIAASTELPKPTALKADGGLAASDTLLQAQADITGLPVARHALRDAAAAGAAIAAGRGVGLLGDVEAAAFTRHDRLFEPRIRADEATARHEAWRAQVYR
ncbi:MAG TPA: FGGY family carbohydrate kinase [Caulobacteraceae bacterium]|jgi:glycerol kinase|nr:FGGY family carbohydrate kinase [Caulobacteraceae bacterium]